MLTEICLRYEMFKSGPYDHIEGEHTKIDIAIISRDTRETAPCYQTLEDGVFLREFSGNIEGSLIDKLRKLGKEINLKTNYSVESTNMPCNLKDDIECEEWEEEIPGGPFEIHYGTFGAGHWSRKGETEEERIAEEKKDETKNSEMHDKIFLVFEEFAQENNLVLYL